MFKFSELNIAPIKPHFTGDKIQLKRLVGKEIIVLKYTIGPSSKTDGDCLTLQIFYDNEKMVVFTGAKYLSRQIVSIPEDKFPFTTTISNTNQYYEFT